MATPFSIPALRIPWTKVLFMGSQRVGHNWATNALKSICSSLVTLLCLTLCDFMDCSTPDFPVLHYLTEFSQSHVHGVSDNIQPSHSLSLLLPSIFPSIRVFPNELALRIRWPEYWSFSFSTSLSNEYSGLISFRTDWFDLLAGQRTLKSSPAPQFESINSLTLSLLYGPTLTFIHDYWKYHSFNYTDLSFSAQGCLWFLKCWLGLT